MKTPGLAGCLIAATALAGQAAAAAEPMGFDLIISLSPRAAAALQKINEGITVSASCFGDPTAAAAKHGNEVGQIASAWRICACPGVAGSARVSCAGVKAYRLHWIQGAPKVNVNVFSSRLSYGTRNAQGSRAFTVLARVIETCRQRGLSPWTCIAAALRERRRANPTPALPAIAPA